MPKEDYWDRKVADQQSETNSLLRALLAVYLDSMEKTMIQKVKLLYGAGLGIPEIAAVLGTTSNSVSVTLHKIRKSSTKDAKAT